MEGIILSLLANAVAFIGMVVLYTYKLGKLEGKVDQLIDRVKRCERAYNGHD